MDILTFPVGPLQACCYLLVVAGDDAALIDPGGDADMLLEQIEYRKATLRLILCTHGHVDHVGAVAQVANAHPDAELCIHQADADMLADSGASLAATVGLPFQPSEPDRRLADGDTLHLGPHTIEIIHTPGHTPGGVSFLLPREGEPDIVFSGDAMFAGGIGRTDFPGGSYAQLITSIRHRLLSLPPDTVVYPGHGEPTTIDEERRTNPFLR